MRDSMTYVNSVGESFAFGSANVLINQNDFRNYEWTYNSQFNKISSFEKRIKSKKLPVIIVGDDARETANKLFECIEKDVLNNTPGKMYVGDYYIKGYFFASNKKSYKHEKVVELELSFVSDQGYWVKESPYVFRIDDEGSGGDEYGLGYNYDYPYGFSSPISSQNLVNTSFVPSNAIIRVYGAVINPTVTIAGNVYQINTEIGNNEILTINTRDKTAVVIDAEGKTSNVFALRNLEHYLFEKIKPGTLKVVANPECNFDVVLLLERSEPLWT